VIAPRSDDGLPAVGPRRVGWIARQLAQAGPLMAAAVVLAVLGVALLVLAPIPLRLAAALRSPQVASAVGGVLALLASAYLL
jgi:hypothetical protein